MNDLEKVANDLVKGAIKKSIALFKKSKANKENKKDKEKHTENKKHTETKDTPKTNAEVKKSNADEVSDRIENNKVDEINTSLHEFNDDAQLELSKQSKGIHSIENTLDYFDQKLFHSQGGDKTKLDDAQTQGTISNPSNPSDSENEEKQGFFSKLKKFFSNNIVGLSVAGSALGQGVYENIDEIMGKSEAKLADDDAKLDKVIAKESGAKVEGEVSLNDAMKDVKPSTQETQEKQIQQVKDDAKSDKPSFLKENPKFNTSPDEKQYILSDYVTNIMNSSGNVEEKKEIYNQIKNRQDINKTEITNLENHINEISNTTNNTTNQKETNVDVTIKDDRGNVTSQTMTEAQTVSVEKDIAKQNELVELTEEAKKNVKASQELEKVQEAENARNSKSNEKLANKALNDVPKTNPAKDLRPQESGGTINNIADWFKSLFSSKTDESNPQQSSGGGSSGGGGGGGGGSSGGGGGTQAAAGVSGEAGQQGLSGGEIVSNSDAQKDEAQATKSKELQDKAVAEAKVKEKQQEAFERQNQTPAGNPTNQGSKGSSTPSQNLSSVKANNATKDLAQKTTNPSQKPDTITNEKVINNHKIETLPKDSWDEFNTSKK